MYVHVYLFKTSTKHDFNNYRKKWDIFQDNFDKVNSDQNEELWRPSKRFQLFHSLFVSSWSYLWVEWRHGSLYISLYGISTLQPSIPRSEVREMLRVDRVTWMKLGFGLCFSLLWYHMFLLLWHV